MSTPQNPWDEQRQTQPQPQQEPPPFMPPQSPSQAQSGTRPQAQDQPRTPVSPQPHIPFQPPLPQQSQPHVPPQSQAQSPSRPAPFPNATGGGFVANPLLPLYDSPSQATPYAPYAPPYDGSGGPPYGPGGPAGTGPAPLPTPSPAPQQPGLHGHDFVFGPPLAPERMRPVRDRPVLLRSAILALVVLALATVGAVRQAGRDVKDYDNTGEHTAVAWSLKEGRDGPVSAGAPNASPRNLEGTWFQGDTVVRSERARVVAYRIDTGATAWESPLPAGAAMCAAGAETDGTIAVVVYGAGETCDRIAGIDISSGKEVWSKPRTAKDDLSGERLAVSRGVAVTGNAAFRIKDGAQIWTTDRNLPSGCRASGFRGGAALVANGRCGATETVWGIDPTTGKPSWTHNLPKGGGTTLGSPVVATSPVIVNEPAATGAPARLTVLTERGEPAYTIEAGNPVIGSALGAPPRLLADERTIYVPGNNGEALHTSGKFWANQIIAIDRATGRVRWISALPAAVKALGVSVDSKAAPIAIDDADGSLRVWVSAGAGKPPRLVRFDPDDGRIRVLKEYPLRLGVALTADVPKPFEHDGRLFLVNEGAVNLAYRLIVSA